MLKDFICQILSKKKDKERHNVLKLEWQKAELERLLEQRKKESQYGAVRRVQERKQKM